MKFWKGALVVRLAVLCAAPALAFAQDPGVPRPGEDATTLETVVVSGAVPGPSLWRVSRGGHELYVLGTITPLPSNMQWVATEVDEVLSRTDEVIAPGGTEARVGVGDAFKISLLARSAFAATKIPDRKKLSDVLPPLVFRQWVAKKSRFLPNARGVERSRPLFASQDLYYAAITASGMTRADTVWQRVAALAEEKRIPIVQTKVRFPLNLDRRKYKAGIAALAESRVDDHACFAHTLATLESDLKVMRASAMAWATGDQESLLALRHGDVEPACKKTYDQLMGFQQRAELQVEADAKWFAAATSALQRNEVTFAVAPIAKLVGPQGALERFRADGFEIDVPNDDMEQTGATAARIRELQVERSPGSQEIQGSTRTRCSQCPLLAGSGHGGVGRPIRKDSGAG
jgi:uncharacterized protein YbaP (TraB family)